MKIAVLTGMALAMATASFAIDRYESVQGAGFSDDHVGTFVESLHGRLRTHDLQDQGGGDVDWSFVQETPNHSYEATVMNTALRFSSAPVSGKATMNRCDATGAILTPGVPLNAFDGAFAARWIATASTYNYIRVTGFAGLGADSGYEIQLRETTYSIPRWNNSGSQTTVFIIANTTNNPVSGTIFFYGSAARVDQHGGLLAASPRLPGRGHRVHRRARGARVGRRRSPTQAGTERSPEGSGHGAGDGFHFRHGDDTDSLLTPVAAGRPRGPLGSAHALPSGVPRVRA